MQKQQKKRKRWARRGTEQTERGSAARATGAMDPRDDRGAVTAEYALVILAAVAFAGVLVAIMRSEEVRAMLVELVQRALGAAG